MQLHLDYTIFTSDKYFRENSLTNAIGSAFGSRPNWNRYDYANEQFTLILPLVARDHCNSCPNQCIHWPMQVELATYAAPMSMN